MPPFDPDVNEFPHVYGNRFDVVDGLRLIASRDDVTDFDIGLEVLSMHAHRGLASSGGYPAEIDDGYPAIVIVALTDHDGKPTSQVYSRRRLAMFGARLRAALAHLGPGDWEDGDGLAEWILEFDMSKCLWKPRFKGGESC